MVHRPLPTRNGLPLRTLAASPGRHWPLACRFARKGRAQFSLAVPIGRWLAHP
jgi:hypothetical protein